VYKFKFGICEMLLRDESVVSFIAGIVPLEA
jgi:hypothetical protein